MGHPEQDIHNGTFITGHQERDIQNGTGRTGQAELESRKGQVKQVRKKRKAEESR
jgi:hypothetical protein